MTWTNRLRLLGGIFVVTALVAGLTVLFNQRQNTITSFTANVAAQVYSVGADHPGTVVLQRVEDGDRVTEGQTLFTVQSLQLKQDIENGLQVSDTDAYRIDKEQGLITYFAVIDGEVGHLQARQGNSLPAGVALATITADGDRFIEARFRLVPRDYARVHPGSPARITLPNDTIIDGEVTAVAVETGETGTVSTIRVESPELPTVQPALGKPGTPVTVTVELDDTGPLAGTGDVLKDFLAKIGLR